MPLFRAEAGTDRTTAKRIEQHAECRTGSDQGTALSHQPGMKRAEMDSH